MRMLVATGILLAGLASVEAADPIPVGGLGMVSADAKSIFVPAKEGGIEALELATGKVLWTNWTAASRIAGASAKFVYGWSAGLGKGKANGVRVVAIDIANGKTVGLPCPIPLPDWAPTSNTWGRSFQVAARADGDGAFVAWQAGLSYAGGARPTSEVLAAASRSGSGAVLADFGKGKAVPAPGKPSDSDLLHGPGPASFANHSVGGYEITVTQTSPTFVLHVEKEGRRLWSREVAGQPLGPPPP